ncbi:hypothetical protein DAPPUDRAFT_254143 [Daphnia pulex]|uniref:Uncharacterized protein n=1 Tax=Daphnia pulex TaxID=6669 RepID=E9H6D8_DAPPU|nr:hypothetical protein DAPPUDRAFT_254143 [Daphnia pulex]|eukprot:EFX72714.1 hypothetical protein DAPPUDRAFT_254143 [Daphnia pulex]
MCSPSYISKSPRDDDSWERFCMVITGTRLNHVARRRCWPLRFVSNGNRHDGRFRGRSIARPLLMMLGSSSREPSISPDECCERKKPSITAAWREPIKKVGTHLTAALLHLYAAAALSSNNHPRAHRIEPRPKLLIILNTPIRSPKRPQMPLPFNAIACIISRNGNEATTEDGATLVHPRIAAK